LGLILRAALGMLLGLVARAWLATLRMTVVEDARLDRESERPWVLVFWHGEQFPLLGWRRRRPTAVLVSWSKDGDIQARILSALGLTVERGSSSRGGVVGLLSLSRRVALGHDAAFAVDGPRGPRFSVAPGARAAAARAGAVLVPMGSACARGHTFARAWDRYRLPWPFSRVAVALGPPLEPEEATEALIARAVMDASSQSAGRLIEEAA
jgi:hypothetical protein